MLNQAAIRYRDWEKLELTLVSPEDGEPILPPVDTYPKKLEDETDDTEAQAEQKAELRAKYQEEHRYDQDWYLLGINYTQSHTRVNDRDEPDDQDRTVAVLWGIPRTKPAPKKDEGSKTEEQSKSDKSDEE